MPAFRSETKVSPTNPERSEENWPKAACLAWMASFIIMAYHHICAEDAQVAKFISESGCMSALSAEHFWV